MIARFGQVSVDIGEGRDMSTPSIEVIAGEQRRVVPLNKPELVIGRLSVSDIVLEDTKASRKHCTVEFRNGVVRLRDLRSRNGTWVGNARVEEMDLDDGSIFRVGDTLFRVHLTSDSDLIDTGGASSDTVVDEEVVEIPPPAAVGQRGRSHVPPVEPDTNHGLVDEDMEPSVGVAGSLRREVLPPVEPETASTAEVQVGRGPLTRYLAPLIKAARSRPPRKGMPDSPRDVRLQDRKSQTFTVPPGDAQRSAESVDALQQLLFAAIRLWGTDLHIDPREGVFGIRIRIDGLMQEVGQINRSMGLALLNVVKVLCHLDIAKRSIVQEGSFSAELADRRVDFRVSFTPSIHGQTLTLRILDKASVPSQFEDLGMETDLVSEVRRICGQDAGMIIVSGPTGSGKTTTLYTSLKCVDAARRNVVTIEDPVEYNIPSTTQISIDPLHGVTFASVLRSVLRQDPDVILVGEIRDEETADLAMQAATTGHLVLTTVHARDSIGTIFRLLDLGVEPYMIANAVTLAISQRLVRLLCPYCRRPYRPDAHRIRQMRLDERQNAQLFTHVGCARCMNIGYAGRIAIFEMLKFTHQLRDVILTRPTVGEIRKAAGDWLFRSLVDSGYRRVLEGQTTVDEVDRVSSAD